MTRRHVPLWALVTGLALTSGCGRPAPEATAPKVVSLLRESSIDQCTASVALSTGEVEAGVPIEVELEAEAPASLVITLPADADFTPFQVVRRHPATPETPRAEDHVRVTQRVLVRTFAAGEIEFPSLPFAFATPESDSQPAPPDSTGPTGPSLPSSPSGSFFSAGSAVVVETESIPVVVSTLLEDPFDPAIVAEIRPAVPVAEEPLSPWLIGAIALGGLLLLAGLVGAVVRRRRPEPEVDPETWATAALRDLRQRNLPAQHETEPFFVELTGILREYLRRRTGFEAPMKTSAEFVEGLRRDRRFTDEQRGALSDLAQLSDMVKFGRHVAAPAECDRAMGSVERLVELLRPVAEGAPR